MGHWLKLSRAESNEPVILNLDHAVRIVVGTKGTRIVFTDEDAVGVSESIDEIYKMLVDQTPNP